MAEQQKNQRAEKIEDKILKPTHGKHLAESFTPITEKLSEVNESTEKLAEVLNKEDSENENQQKMIPVEFETDDENKDIRALLKIAYSSASLRETLGFLMRSRNSLRIEQDASGRALNLGVPIHPLAGNKIKWNYNVYEITPGIQKAL